MRESMSTRDNHRLRAGDELYATSGTQSLERDAYVMIDDQQAFLFLFGTNIVFEDSNSVS